MARIIWDAKKRKIMTTCLALTWLSKRKEPSCDVFWFWTQLDSKNQDFQFSTSLNRARRRGAQFKASSWQQCATDIHQKHLGTVHKFWNATYRVTGGWQTAPVFIQVLFHQAKVNKIINIYNFSNGILIFILQLLAPSHPFFSFLKIQTFYHFWTI